MRPYLALHAAASFPAALTETAALHVACSPYSARTLAIYSSIASLTIALMLPAPPQMRFSNESFWSSST